jgi:multicomponent Na+:H+ antiporter subunit D
VTVGQFLPAALAAHAPVLLVAIPLILSAPAAALKSGRTAWGIAFAGAVAALLFAIELFLATRGEGAVISYALGAWQPPVGIEFRVDALNAALLLLLTASAVLALIFALPSVEDEIDKDKRALFYSAFLVVLSGLAGVATTGDAFNMFVFLEISSIPTYALIAMGARMIAAR